MRRRDGLAALRSISGFLHCTPPAAGAVERWAAAPQASSSATLPKAPVTTTSPTERDRDLALAIGHHMAGRYDEAERIYLRLHEGNRNDEEVLYLIGVLCCDLGIFPQACRFLEQALTINPQFPEATQQLAVALKGQADLDIQANQLDAADAALTRAQQLHPDDGQCLLTLGKVAMMRNDPARAESWLEQALKILGNDVDALNWHGLVCLQQQKYARADQSLRQALGIKPNLSQARNNLGQSLFQQGRLGEAHDCFMATIAHDPGYANARINLANTQRILGKPDQARFHLEQLLPAHPDSVEVHNNLGTALQDLGEAEAARNILERAAELAPQSPQVRWNLALSQLLLGDYRQGWANYEARWDGCANLKDAYNKPPELAWRGEALDGKRLLLWAEQGFGDTLQFIRFAAQLAELGAIVIVEAQPELAELLAGAPGVSSAVARGQTLPPYDLHCPLMSLPHRLGMTDAAAGSAAYLHADPVRSAYWNAQLAPYPGKKIGVAWAGKSRGQHAELAAIDARRSVTLEQLSPLFDNRQRSFFSLQKDRPAEEIAESALPLHDFSAAWKDFSDTAAFIANLDLVITVDTAIAHLAGALGKPVWLLNRYDSCWRWQRERLDSPWYPALRQFRQARIGEWDAVITAVADELEKLTAQ